MRPVVVLQQCMPNAPIVGAQGFLRVVDLRKMPRVRPAVAKSQPHVSQSSMHWINICERLVRQDRLGHLGIEAELKTRAGERPVPARLGVIFDAGGPHAPVRALLVNDR